MTTILFVLLPHVHLMDLAGPDQVFLEAIGYGADMRVQYCSCTDTVTTSAALPFGAVQNFREVSLTEGDFVIIPGAELSYLQSPEFRSRTDLFEWIRECRQRGIRLCSICSGAFALAESGVLDGRECTTHWKRTSELQQMYPTVQVIDNVLFTEDDGIYTSAGIASGIDLALYLVEEMNGEYFAHKVAREMVIYSRRNGNMTQHSELLSFRNHIHAGIHKVQDWLHEHLHEKFTIGALADIAAMSERNFTRIFKKETSLTVHQYITRLRKEKIEQLMRNSDISQSQVAALCGLTSERQISRIKKKR
jgi:transcriptional regulator GlxA family with amidase domain